MLHWLPQDLREHFDAKDDLLLPESSMGPYDAIWEFQKRAPLGSPYSKDHSIFGYSLRPLFMEIPK